MWVHPNLGYIYPRNLVVHHGLSSISQVICGVHPEVHPFSPATLPYFFLFLIGSSAKTHFGEPPLGGRAHSLPPDALHPTPGAGDPDARRDEFGDQQAAARGGGGQLQKYRGMGEEKGHWLYLAVVADVGMFKNSKTAW